MEEVFKKIGGFDTVDLISDDYTMRFLNDADLSPYCDGFCHEELFEMQRKGMAFLLGATHQDSDCVCPMNKYLLERGFSDKQFDRLKVHLEDTLRDFSFTEEDIVKLTGIVESKRDIVLDRPSVKRVD
ncbi:MAG: hypothetical protein ACRBHB_07270 [Arenicella sp.]